ncbi:MAG: mannose-1-phosphate guanylyltransferase/mannose-6-phosphate isomerase [Chlamydiae bacterium CG10_big_fil_rev_8_21_14_0_10_42_34]|nr:MAG: mannose-1-phosphate guanylyltransferase/mannose-6-phosphate isomerase [Chlamydiae bacterium CG10_big_fil_rev_8_21_14_0_10_42_34]
MKAIVLAGGGGTRLWPLSREHLPKQFLKFGEGLSLLQRTVNRLQKAPFIDDVVVATSEHHFALVKEHLDKIGADCRIFVEPVRKNTAPAIALAIKILQEECGAKENEPILVVPSDHLIEPEVVFLHAIEQVISSVSTTNKIITFGIRPTKPETGYGYIEIGKEFDSLTFEAKRFIEKPDLKTAEKYVENPNFFWNSGMFLFSMATFWEQVKLHCPELGYLFKLEAKEVREQFERLPDISIDYAIMEKSKEILVCPLAISWSDVGSWDSVYDAMEKDHNQNVTVGQVMAIDTTNSLIIGGKRIISTIGLDDLLIVETEDAILISKKGESQRVKALLEEMRERANHQVVGSS